MNNQFDYYAGWYEPVSYSKVGQDKSQYTFEDLY